MGHVVPDAVPFYTSEIFGLFFRCMLDAELKGTRPLQIWGTLSQGSHTPHRQGPGKMAEFRETFFRSEEGAVGNNEKRVPGVLFSYH